MDRDRKVDINVVTGDELATLLGIGKSKADAIIEHRKLSGRFNSIDDLVSIPGIGQGFSDLNFTGLFCFPLEKEDLEEPKPPPTTLNNNVKRVIPKWSRTSSKPAMASCWSQTEATCSRKKAPCTKSSEHTSGSSSSAEDPSEYLVCCHQTNGTSSQKSDEDLAVAGEDPLTAEDPAAEASPPLRSFQEEFVELEEEVLDPDFRIEVSPPPCGNGDSESLASDQRVEAEDEEEEEEELTTPDDPCELDEVMGQEQCESQRPPPCPATVVTAIASTCNPEASRMALEDDFESISTDCDEGCSKFSRDKIMMKRKKDVESQDPMAGKKLCLTGNADVEEGAHTNELFPEVPHVGHDRLLSAVPLNLKKRIPTKDNPPPELAKWLETFQIWGNAERMMAIDQIIDLCEPTQVRHMMSVIEPQFQRDFISLLPKELALYVLSFLEPKYLLRAAQTCRYWHILAEDNLLWREKCRESGMEEIIMQDDEFVRDTLNKKRPKVGPVPSPWKAAYMRQHNIEMNWRFRPIRPPKVLKGHDDHVITCLQFCGTRIVSGSDDNTLKVWSATTGKCLKTLVGHTGGVWSSQMAGHIIVSGSTDRTLKVWNADSGSCIHTLYGHTSTVRCMHLHGNTVVSGSRDATLRVWDIETGQCLHVLIGHVAAVRCVQYDGRLVVSGAYDYVVKVWNPEREECLHTLQGHTNRVYSLQFDGLHVVSGSLDTSIRVWDVETGACKHTLMGHQSLTSGMELKNNILVSGNADSTVKVWDITTGQCLQTLSGTHKHNSAVTCLQFNSKFVITSSDDGTVKLWDLKTGEFIRNLVALESGGSGGVVWRIRASPTKLVCAVGSRNGTEETKLLVLDFDAAEAIK